MQEIHEDDRGIMPGDDPSPTKSLTRGIIDPRCSTTPRNT